MTPKIVKVAIFYDGGFFWHVNNYYHYIHNRKSPVSITGLHHYVRNQISSLENVDVKYTRIVDAHYFRGRMPAVEAQNRNRLYADRVFEDVLMREGVITHFLPVTPKGEKGVDVWLSLDCYEMAVQKKYDVVVLIASDSDYIPLVKKLNTLGTRVMVLGWDFDFVDNYGNKQVTVTSAGLIDNATYPISMHSEIEELNSRNEEEANLLFIAKDLAGYDDLKPAGSTMTPYGPTTLLNEDVMSNYIVQLHNGYGFIATETPGKNLFFHYSQLENCDFAELVVGDKVDYKLAMNDKGEFAVEINRVS